MERVFVDGDGIPAAKRAGVLAYVGLFHGPPEALHDVGPGLLQRRRAGGPPGPDAEQDVAPGHFERPEYRPRAGRQDRFCQDAELVGPDVPEVAAGGIGPGAD
jgi:hypothetical protein